jgi:hypothetical protein
MTENAAKRGADAWDDESIAKAHAIYTPSMLSIYDVLVHGLSNHLAWRCPTGKLLDLYRANLSANHLEAGVGTGYFLDRAGRSDFERLVLLDINKNCLARAEQRLARFKPALHQANLLAPLDLDLAPFTSIGLTYVLHCLPGNMSDKLVALDHLRPFMEKDVVLFGATILGRGIKANWAARKLLDIYNEKGVFNNPEDDLPSLTHGLRRRFDDVHVEMQGCVALFYAR